eukprot:1136916-Prorocentrum_minimum.AAC.1
MTGASFGTLHSAKGPNGLITDPPSMMGASFGTLHSPKGPNGLTTDPPTDPQRRKQEPYFKYILESGPVKAEHRVY